MANSDPQRDDWEPPVVTGSYDPARVARVEVLKEAVTGLGLPLVHFRKMKCILGALEVQIECGGDHPRVNALLLEALRASVRHHVKGARAQPVLDAIDAYARDDEARWELVRAGRIPAVFRTPEDRIADLVHEGQAWLRSGPAARACEPWLRAWEEIRALVRPGIATIDALREAYPGLEMALENWPSELVYVLRNAARRAAAGWDTLLRVVRECQALFPDEADWTRSILARDEAEALWHLGRRAEAEAAFTALTARWPEDAWGYLNWSRCYWDDAAAAPDFARGEAILRRALDNPRLEDREEVADALAELREQRARSLRPQPAPRALPRPEATRAGPPHRPGRNDPCWCGSGKKYKNCHLRQDSR